MIGFESSDVFGSQNTVYKVVDSGLGSALARGHFYVHYRPGEFVAAPAGTKFFVLNHWNTPKTSHGRTFVCKSGRPRQEAWTSHRGELATRPIQSTCSISGRPTIAGNLTACLRVIEPREAPCGLTSFALMSALCLTTSCPRRESRCFMGGSAPDVWQTCSPRQLPSLQLSAITRAAATDLATGLLPTFQPCPSF